ncbi:PA0069 family radical SAM protein [Aquibaculum sediminis]|uniref:PA0069 family radical SAM protein n=1 Tax=Aquibaculum sediminis TaxID=3231907 RepID=UPI003453C96D
MDERRPEQAIKGRGAVGNPTGRFEAYEREATWDGWWLDPEELEERPATSVLPDASRSILARNDSPDVPFERSINPYRGCEHGCIYCFARPSHAYLGLSPGLDFETRLFAKHQAPQLLREALRKRGYKPSTLALGANTDPYQPVERKLEITRGLLQVLAEANHPVSIITKSALVLRDLDILAPMAREGLVRVCLSITTLDGALARILEPRAAQPKRRLEALRRLTEAGVPVAVLAAPMIPAINDMEMEAILEAGAEAGADRASWILLRLPRELGPLFEQWLETHFPQRKAKVLNLLRDTRGGALYDARFGSRMRGEGPYAFLLARRFSLALRRLGLDKRSWDLDISRFRTPGPEGQMALF